MILEEKSCNKSEEKRVMAEKILIMKSLKELVLSINKSKIVWM